MRVLYEILTQILLSSCFIYYTYDKEYKGPEVNIIIIIIVLCELQMTYLCDRIRWNLLDYYMVIYTLYKRRT